MFKDGKDYDQSLRGLKWSDEMKARQSDAKKGKKLSDATKQKISEATKGRKHSDATKQKMAIANQNRQYRPTIIHQGKTLHQWAEKLNISNVYAYVLYSQGRLTEYVRLLNPGRPSSIFFEGKSITEWSQELGITTMTVRNRLKRTGDPRIKKVITNKQPKETNKQKYMNTPALEGKTAIEWAEELGISRSAVYNNLKNYGTPYGKKKVDK